MGSTEKQTEKKTAEKRETPSDGESLSESFFRKSLKIVIIALIVCFFPGAFIYAAIETAKEDGWHFVYVIILIGCILVIACVIFMAASLIIAEIQLLREKKKRDSQIAPAAGSDGSKKNKRAVKAIFVCIAVVLVGCCALGAVKPIKTELLYRSAVDNIAEGRYDEAEATLNEIGDTGYKDTGSLKCLCKARRYYDEDDVVMANYWLKDAVFLYLTGEPLAEVDSFRSQVKREYDKYVKARSGDTGSSNGSPTSTPYVGMHATNAQISRWEWLGTDYRTCSVKTVKYHYDASQGDYTIWIDENNVVQKVSKSAPPEKNRKGISSGDGKNDGPSVDGFADVEDFYDLYYDDFIDFDEAEEYYEEHGGY